MSASPAIALGRPPRSYTLPETATLGRVRLAVSSLERSLAFYSGILGLTILERSRHLAQLGTPSPAGADAPVLLELEEQPGLLPLGRSQRLGLYHTAFLLPTRLALSSFIRHLRHHAVPFAASDHLVSEALYLTDPDGLTVEVYADRERSLWPRDGQELLLDTQPLRFADLPSASENSWQGAPPGTRVGHLHFYVGDLPAAAAFYHAALGFSAMTWRYPGALFLAAGGYHHHVGINTWAAGSPLASAQDPRLLFWELILPSAEELARTTASLRAAGFAPVSTSPSRFADPFGITVSLRTAQAPTVLAA